MHQSQERGAAAERDGTREVTGGAASSYSAASAPAPAPGIEALERFRTTVELAPVGIAHLDRDWRFLFVNDRWCEILGHPRSRLLDAGFADAVFGEDRTSFAAMQQVLSSGAVRHVLERTFPHADGSMAWARITVSRVPGTGGAPPYLIAAVEDVSQERADEAARREAKERLRSALEASATGTYRWDLRTSVIEWEGQLDRLFGLPAPATRDESTGTVAAFLAQVHPDDRRAVLEHCWLRVDSGEPLDVEFRVVLPDGTARWLCATGRPMRDAGGTPAFIAGACTDVTERRHAADALREQEARFRTLADTIPQLAWMADANGAIQWYNQRWYDYTGTTLDAVQGWGWKAVHHPDHVARVVARIRESFEAGEPWEDTFPLRRHDGEYRWFLSRALPMRDVDGHIVGWFGTNTDVTERFEAEQAEHASRVEAERASRMRDEVLAVVAHDLRNPVHTIAMGASNLLELPLDEAQRRRQLGAIQRAARGMNQLIGDLLDATRIEAGTFTVSKGRVHVRTLLGEAVEQFEEPARARGVELRCEVDKGVPAVLADRDRLLQVLSNLLGNALKFTPSGGFVRLRANRAPGPGRRWVEVAVEDSGIGIAPDHLPHVFDRFWQASRSTRAGAGLGLAIVKGIVEAHGGRVRVESQQGAGTVVTFTLPAERRGRTSGA